MTRLNTRRWAEIVGLLGVVGSLVFVGLEVRQSSRATRAATDAEIAAQFVELNLAMINGPELGMAFDAAREAGHPSEAPIAAQTTILAFYRALFHIWSNTHRQHLNGTVNPLLFQAVVNEISSYSVPAGPEDRDRIRRTRVLMKWAWESERFIYNAEFRSFVDSIIDSKRRLSR
jgi:hypothetical protein